MRTDSWRVFVIGLVFRFYTVFRHFLVTQLNMYDRLAVLSDKISETTKRYEFGM